MIDIDHIKSTVMKFQSFVAFKLLNRERGRSYLLITLAVAKDSRIGCLCQLSRRRKVSDDTRLITCIHRWLPNYLQPMVKATAEMSINQWRLHCKAEISLPMNSTSAVQPISTKDVVVRNIPDNSTVESLLKRRQGPSQIKIAICNVIFLAYLCYAAWPHKYVLQCNISGCKIVRLIQYCARWLGFLLIAVQQRVDIRALVKNTSSIAIETLHPFRYLNIYWAKLYKLNQLLSQALNYIG